MNYLVNVNVKFCRFFFNRFCKDVRIQNQAFVVPLYEENKIEIYIRFYEIKKNKYITFHRCLDENVDQFSERAKVKINLAIENKIAKKKKDYLTQYLVDSVRFGTESEFIESTSVLRDVLSCERTYLWLGKKKIPVDSKVSWIRMVSLPRTVNVKKIVVPICKMVRGNQADFQFTWLLSKDGGKKFYTVHQGNFFYPELEHNDCHLQVVCWNSVTNQKEHSHNICKIVAVTEVAEREKRHKLMRETVLGANEFRVMTYNVLADYYADRLAARQTLFKHCAPEYLCMSHRQPLLMHEMLDSRSDIICFQETDKHLYHDYFTPLVTMHGYHGIYTARSHNEREGLSVFWRDAKFKLVEDLSQSKFNLSVLQDPKFAKLNRYIRSLSPLVQDYWVNSYHAFGACILQSRDNPDHRITIVTVHLTSAINFCHLRHIQLASILQYLINHRHQHNLGTIIMMGDFNSLPYSLPIQYMLGATSLTIQSDLSNLEQYDHQSEFTIPDLLSQQPIESSSEEEGQLEGPEFRHGLQFVKPVSYESTNFTPQFYGELDHVIYESSSDISGGSGIEFVRDFAPPDLSYLRSLENGGLPNEHWPSDHLSLVMDFRFI